MKDLLRGTLGKFLQVILVLASVVFMFVGIGSCAMSSVGGGKALGIILFIVGVLCGCGVFGIRYWLGHVVRLR